MKKIILLAVILCSCDILFAQEGSTFVNIKNISESIITEIRYASSFNFVGVKVDGYKAPKCLLTKSAAEALVRVQTKLESESYSLKIFDCYRPQQAVNHFVKWASSDKAHFTKAVYFPRVPVNKLFELGYIAERSGHSRGSTVDLTIVRLPYQKPEQFNYACIDPEGYKFRGSELNMGTAYDCFDELSHTINNDVEEEVLENRKMLLKAMQEEGFVNYSKEWWHFTYKPEEFPDTYFDLPIE
ncbi:MAG: M15 family metallopeptidase [Balneolaceae bacterium]|nr:M15 family metallopeptidase [Balneolaceae bacterium]MBO6546708.1 M15 family metallopeptidase [Balneolaceae bacterium]MBO6649066.1 M15 family metallopeptidase [Balneolaceae bacterium]